MTKVCCGNTLQKYITDAYYRIVSQRLHGGIVLRNDITELDFGIRLRNYITELFYGTMTELYYGTRLPNDIMDFGRKHDGSGSPKTVSETVLTFCL